MELQCVPGSNGRSAIQIRDNLYPDVVKKMCVLEKSYKILPRKKEEGMEDVRQLLEATCLTLATGVLIRLRDPRKLSYGEKLASFITRLASHDKKNIENQLDAATSHTYRLRRTQTPLHEYEAGLKSMFIFLPFLEEEVMLTVRRSSSSFQKRGYAPAGSMEILCEMLENPDRFVGKTYLADGDEVVVGKERCVPAFSIQEDGQWFIRPIPERETTKRSYRALTLIIPS